jgi:hypothetical protein
MALLWQPTRHAVDCFTPSVCSSACTNSKRPAKRMPKGIHSLRCPRGWRRRPRRHTAQHERYHQAQEHVAAWQAAHQHSSPSERRAPAKIVASIGAPEAALGVDKDQVFRPLYTIHTVRDGDAPLLLGYDVCA